MPPPASTSRSARSRASRRSRTAETDPHFWLDPDARRRPTSPTSATRSSKADPDGAAEYEANAAAYVAKLDELDAWIEARSRRSRRRTACWS